MNSCAPASSICSPTQRVESVLAVLADRLADPEQCAQVAAAHTNVDSLWGVLLWDPVGLAIGHPGIAIFFAELARTDAGFLRPAHRHIEAAARALGSRPSNGLYYGPTSLLAAVQTCRSLGAPYTSLHRRLVAWVAKDLHTRAHAWDTQLAHPSDSASWGAYDVINGLSGQTRILLDELDTSNEVVEAVDSALTVLTRVCATRVVRGRTVPGWYVSCASQPVPEDKERYPDSDFNLGMAHGIAGPTALWAIILKRDLGWEDQATGALAHTASWLRDRACRDAHGIYWEARRSWRQECQGTTFPRSTTRSAWCYGSPGVAAALLHVPDHIAPKAAQTAATALEDLATLPSSEHGLDGSTVCHGSAGVLQIVNDANSSLDSIVRSAVSVRLVENILDQVSPNHPFLVKHQIPTGPRNAATGRRALNGVDIAGLLEGAAGVGCALASWLRKQPTASETGAPSESNMLINTDESVLSWSRVLMLS